MYHQPPHLPHMHPGAQQAAGPMDDAKAGTTWRSSAGGRELWTVASGDPHQQMGHRDVLAVCRRDGAFLTHSTPPHSLQAGSAASEPSQCHPGPGTGLGPGATSPGPPRLNPEPGLPRRLLPNTHRAGLPWDTVTCGVASAIILLVTGVRKWTHFRVKAEKVLVTTLPLKLSPIFVHLANKGKKKPN